MNKIAAIWSKLSVDALKRWKNIFNDFVIVDLVEKGCYMEVLF